MHTFNNMAIDQNNALNVYGKVTDLLVIQLATQTLVIQLYYRKTI